MQTTVKSSIEFKGVGLHSGRPVRMVIRPASAEYGIWFRRTDLAGQGGMIPARWSSVEPSRLCTLLRNDSGASVSTVEHVMAALAGCGVNNALIDLDGPEVPIMDGSAAPFVRAVLTRGLQPLAAPVRVLRILEPVEVCEGAARARLVPAEGFEIDFQIDFEDAAIGRQHRFLNMANGAFVRELCDSRTFCRQRDVDMMRENGLALGGSLTNAVVVEGAAVLSPGGLRHADEPVRHKMLDALGDLALAGAPILGRYEGERAGHALTNKLLRTLFASPNAYRLETCSGALGARLPGAGVCPADFPAAA
ncbi:UDP-3-O-[3-hydroxymyristoyl] N-acetylglucosamine deacetylase [Rhodovulum imhoffii]|uniref:UDP-3-O-acyl-N-acetylglucosamine deacetylase n=1 Tax=Rhodovulum imhoffii TaxID=365340 RepID=A0A2T5BPH4_9RHOB|nr:UDP-3-O-acyl-N-acetylglucosamine deacetylase [Rhodovulum imhoffii]MBK5932897.1 UDP-3-O-[3-hydroxymyristoyl] N-acetylglucosamine deacetylase [Rhodovulum imhoffii]PTN00947.1 UDP-3-O-[3-hydroxymyristoyl] N-acetylglucosamine deacetylase [Rhodovulum imhoffii]